MEIQLNGEAKPLPAETTLEAFLLGMGLEPSHLVVEINGEFIESADFAAMRLKSGDRLEVLRFVGGG